MILSASYKTDLPALYGEWFLNRLRAGCCLAPNPYSGRPFRVSLTRDSVDGIVFWTRNLGPFRGRLEEVHCLAYPFVIQFTITGYPRELESGVIDSRRAVEQLRQAAERYGPRVCVWRYDPIVDTSLTPRAFHTATFARLAGELEGATDEVVLSFAQLYGKTRRGLERAARAHGLTWSDPADEWKRALAAELAGIAASRGMRLTVCGQPALVPPGCAAARCIDAGRLSDVAGRAILARERPHRKECGCYESKDIGAYDTCPQGCVYCYAVSSIERARANLRAHDPTAESLGALRRPSIS
ncbi:MAG TPA: DUF1848 domain-containing protein [Anaerolineae bacterium]|nr:DUF1848 domain-containing protein [Anaerolineae bacterium]